ncbi:MAG: hypothetical protein AAGG69_02185 [Pseudomonadota bacterium]
MANDAIVLINPKTFKPAWNAVRGIRPSKTTLDMLTYAHLEVAESGLCTLTCTDMDIEGAAKFQASASAPQAMLLPAPVCDYMAGFTDGEIKLRLDADTFRVHASQGRSRTHMATLEARDFPSLQSAETTFCFEFLPGELLPAMETALTATSTDEAHYYLQAVVFEIEGNAVNVLATDRHRLHITNLDLDGDPPETSVQILMHRDHVRAALRAFSNESTQTLTLKGHERQVTLTNGVFSITGKQIDATYFDWRRVIPEGHTEGRLKLETGSLASIAARMKHLRGEGDIVLEIQAEKGALTLRGKRSLRGDDDTIEDVIDASDSAKGHGFFALDYFADALGAGLSDNAMMDITAPHVTAMKIEDPDRGKTIVIMQRRGV